MNRDQILKYINNLGADYEGYVQFSHRALDDTRDIFRNNQPVKVSDEPEGFIVEAYFCNDDTSITIRRNNDSWYVDEQSISGISGDDLNAYLTKYNLRVKMAQIWIDEEDENCCDFKVKKLQKVVFAGFEPIDGKGGES